MDRRAIEECEWIRKEIGEDKIFNKTGNVIDLYYGFPLRRQASRRGTQEEMGIPRDFFPEEINCSKDVVGEITDEGAKATGLKKGTQVVAGGIDAPHVGAQRHGTK